MQYRGRVKMWSYDKGYGFIRGDGAEIFAHISEVERGPYPPPIVGKA